MYKRSSGLIVSLKISTINYGSNFSFGTTEEFVDNVIDTPINHVQRLLGTDMWFVL